MKKYIKSLLMLTSLVLSGCGNLSKDYIYGRQNYELIYSKKTEYTTINYSNFERLVANKSSFVLLLSTGNCSECEKYNPVFLDYVEKTNQQIYDMRFDDLTREEKRSLNGKYVEIFTNMTLLPNIYIINNGKLTYNVTAYGYDEKFNSIMNIHVLKSPIYTLNSKNSLLDFFSKYDSLVYLSVENSDLNSYQAAQQLAYEKEKNLLILDKNILDLDCYSYICSLNNVEDINSDFAFVTENGQKKSAYQEGTQLIDYINLFFAD